MKIKFPSLCGAEVYSHGKLVAILPLATEGNVDRKAVSKWVQECGHEETSETPRLSADCFYLELYDFEYTDTFCGETNYAWVKRGTIYARDRADALRKAKKELGLSGVRCRFNGVGWIPSGNCTILFVD